MSASKSKTILLVEDDSVIRELVKVGLGHSNFRFLEAVNGQDACDILSSEKGSIDLVLLDAIMPFMDGFDTCKKIRKQSEFESLPIIMLTSLCDVESIGNAFKCGATDFLAKPIVFPLLIQRINLAFENAELTHALNNKRSEIATPQNDSLLTWCYNLKDKSITLSDELRDLLIIEENKEFDLAEFSRLIEKSVVNDLKNQMKFTLQHRYSEKIAFNFINSLNELIPVKQSLRLESVGSNCLIMARIKIDSNPDLKVNEDLECQDKVTESPNHFILDNANIDIETDKLEGVFFPYKRADRNSLNNVAALTYWLSLINQKLSFEEMSVLADEKNLNIVLGRLTIESAFNELKLIHENGFPDVKLILRLTQHQLFSSDTSSLIIELCNSKRIPKSRVFIEVSEQLMDRALNKCRASLGKLRKVGLDVSIKNFDVINSKWPTPEAIPLMILKIDRTSIRGRTEYSRYYHFFSSIAEESQAQHNLGGHTQNAQRVVGR